MSLRTGCLLLLALAVAAGCERRADDGGTLIIEDEEYRPLEPSQIGCDIAAPPPGAATVQVVFSCDEEPVGSWRVVPAGTPDTLQLALDALLRGPTPEERASGLFSFFGDETAGMLNRAQVRDGVAYIDFRDFSRVIPNASTSAGSAQLLDQIAGTVFQFDGVREAELSFDGSCDAFWNWLQRGCERLLRDEPHE
jgi:hypothetical protein